MDSEWECGKGLIFIFGYVCNSSVIMGGADESTS